MVIVIAPSRDICILERVLLITYICSILQSINSILFLRLQYSKMEGNREAYLEELRTSNYNAYLEVLNLDNIAQADQRELLKKAHIGHTSQSARLLVNVQILKHLYVTNRTDMITACFKVTRGSVTCIYGYLHSECSLGQDPTFTHKFTCASPTYKSQDGEYRHRLIPMFQFDNIFEKYREEFDNVEYMVITDLEDGDISLSVDFYFPPNCKVDRSKYRDSVNCMRIMIKMYMLCWIVDFYQITNAIMENHINPAYLHNIYNPDAKVVYDELVDDLGGIAKYTNLVEHAQYCTDLSKTGQFLTDPQCGQKIIPVTIWEMMKPDDINFSVWREIYITNLCSNLVLNLISPSFAFMSNWFYIHNTRRELFDNPAMHEKYDESELATKISTKLRNTDRYNYVDMDKSNNPINNKFMKLSKSIQKSTVYSDAHIRLTDMAICMTSEYVGRTIMDLPALANSAVGVKGMNKFFTDKGVFSKQIFEFIYGFYCMNSKVGVIHGDVHINNATIYTLYDFASVPSLEGSTAAYHVNGNTYLFPHVGLISMIIDFSRSIVGDYDRLEHEFGPRYTSLYFKNQKVRLLQLIYNHFPKIAKMYEDNLEILLDTKFPLMFKILTAIDPYILMTNITTMLNVDKVFTSGDIKISPDFIELLEQITNMAEKLIKDNIGRAIDSNVEYDDIEWPNLTIFRKCFKQFKITDIAGIDAGKIVDIFNYNNDMKYDIEDYESWGPVLSMGIEYKLQDKYGFPHSADAEQWFKYKQNDESAEINKIVEKHEKLEEDVIQFESWMLL